MSQQTQPNNEARRGELLKEEEKLIAALKNVDHPMHADRVALIEQGIKLRTWINLL